MQSFHAKASAREAATARRALELFLEVHNLTWQDSYQLAVYERSMRPWYFSQVIGRIQKGKTLKEAVGDQADTPMPISNDVGDRAWERRK